MYIKSVYHIWKLNIYMSTKNAIFNSELFIPIIECNSIYRSSINIFHGSRSSSKILKGISINVNGSLIHGIISHAIYTNVSYFHSHFNH